MTDRQTKNNHMLYLFSVSDRLNRNSTFSELFVAATFSFVAVIFR